MLPRFIRLPRDIAGEHDFVFLSSVIHAVRAFNLTALLVALHMVRASRFAGRVLFPGSGDALNTLAQADLSDLLSLSTDRGLISSPLLGVQGSVGRFLANTIRGSLSRPTVIALSQARSIASLPAPDTLCPFTALSGVS